MTANTTSLEKGDVVTNREEPVETCVPPAASTDDPAVFRRRPVLFRSTLFQIVVVGLCAFCAPGIWNAMNGLGVGGSETPELVNAANALLYAFMTVTCFSGPWLTTSLDSAGHWLWAPSAIHCTQRDFT